MLLESRNRLKKIKNKMNCRDKTKDELIKELQKLHQEFDSLKISYEKDITERKRAVETLRMSEVRYRALAESSPDAITQADLRGRILMCNQQTALMHGYEGPENLIGTSVFELFHPDEIERANKNLQNTLKDRVFRNTEYRLLKKDGSQFHGELSAIAVPDAEGKPTCFVVVTRDITERKLYEEVFNKNEKRFRAFVEHAPLAIILIRDGIVLYANQKASNMYGLQSIEEFKGRQIADSFAPQFREAIKERSRRRSLGLPIPLEFESVALRVDGSKFPLQVAVSQIRLSDGIANIVFITDITERKKAEEEIKKSKKLLKALNKHLIEIRENERAQIAINLHDDIGQKLTAMNLNLAWVKSRIGVQSQVVKNKLEDISLLINETYENIRKISSDLRPSILFDFGLIEAIVLQLKKFENQSGIRYSFNYKPAEFKIDTQLSLAIYRILLESLTNIIRHSQATFSEVSLNLIDSRVELVIKDNGKGIEKEKINSLTSMGIMGMKERVRLVNGKLLIAGKKGSGTTIKVSIPVTNRKKHDKSTDYR